MFCPSCNLSCPSKVQQRVNPGLASGFTPTPSLAPQWSQAGFNGFVWLMPQFSTTKDAVRIHKCWYHTLGKEKKVTLENLPKLRRVGVFKWANVSKALLPNRCLEIVSLQSLHVHSEHLSLLFRSYTFTSVKSSASSIKVPAFNLQRCFLSHQFLSKPSSPCCNAQKHNRIWKLTQQISSALFWMQKLEGEKKISIRNSLFLKA